MKREHILNNRSTFIAWLDGAVIETLDCFGKWRTVTEPSWLPRHEYRVQPDKVEPEPEIKYLVHERHGYQTTSIHGPHTLCAYINHPDGTTSHLGSGPADEINKAGDDAIQVWKDKQDVCSS